MESLLDSTGTSSDDEGEKENKNASVSIYITSNESELESDSTADAEKTTLPAKQTPTNETSNTIQIHKDQGRPNLRAIIALCSAASGEKNIGIVVCGPGAMIQDVRDAVAEEQVRVLREGNQGEVYLYVEYFS